MDRLRPTYVRQDSTSSSTGTPGSMSPLAHRHTRSGSGAVGVKRTPQTKAAAARLAQVMSHQDSDDDEDDLDLIDYKTAAAPRGLGLAGSRPAARSREPLTSARTSTGQAGAARSGIGLRSANSAGSVEQEQTSSRISLSGRSSNASSVGKISPARSALGNRPSQSADGDDDEDDLDLYNPAGASPGLGLGGTRPTAGSRSPLTSARTSTGQAGAARPGTGLRSSHSAGSVEQEQTSSRISLTGRSSNVSSVEKISPARSVLANRPSQSVDGDDDEDDLDLYNPAGASPGLGLGGTRPAARSRSPLTSARTSTGQAGAARPGTGLRSSHSAGSVEQEQTSSRISLTGRSSNVSSVEKISPARSVLANRPSQPGDSDDDEDDLDLYNPAGASPGLGLGDTRPTARSRSPLTSARTSTGQAGAARFGTGLRSANSAGSVEQEQTSSRISLSGRSSNASSVGKISPARSVLGNRPSQPVDGDDDEDDLDLYNPSSASPGLGLGGTRPAAISGSPLKISPARSVLVNRPSQSTTTPEPVVSPYARPTSPAVVKTSVPGNRSFRSTNTAEPVMSPYDRSTSPVEQVQKPATLEKVQISSLRSFRSNSMEQPHSARTIAVGRPSVGGIKPATIVPAAVNVTLKATASDTQKDVRKEKKLVEFGTFKYKDTGEEPTASSDLQDNIEILQEENENLLKKLRLAEERREEAEERARQLEQQIANLGDGVSLEARLLSRKEASLQQREAALKAAALNTGGRGGGEVAALRMEAETAKEEAATASEQLNDVVAEYKSLRSMTQRMILTQEEMEEVVLKRCWLSRYWSLCVRHGIHAEIAAARYEYWSALAPLPVDVVLAAAERAKEEHGVSNDAEERERKLQKRDEFSGEGNVENMLLVDKGLKELTCLKVEEALVIAMAQKRRAAPSSSALTDEVKLPIEGKNYSEGFELTEEEQEDVTFKQAWLAYFWRRVKNHGLEPDIADERLQYWIDRISRSPISNDAVDVERGLVELKKLAIEIKLWEISRLSVNPDSSKKTLLDFDN